jgi:hypothetical protein
LVDDLRVILLNTVYKMTTLDNVNKSDTKTPIPIHEPTLKTPRKLTRACKEAQNKSTLCRVFL